MLYRRPDVRHDLRLPTRSSSFGAPCCQGALRAIVLTGVLAANVLTGCVSDPNAEFQNASRERKAAQNPEALARIGDAAVHQNDMKTAAAFYGRAVALQPDNANLVIPYAESLAFTGRVNDATQAVRAAMTKTDEKGRVRLTVMLARLLTLSHHTQDAIALLRPAIVAHPNDATLQIALGVAFDAAQDHSGAQTAYRRALQLDPSSLAAQNNLALSQALAGQRNEGLEALNRLRTAAVEQGASDAQIATIDGNIAIIYALEGDVANARRAGVGASSSNSERIENARFYSLLAPGGGGSVAAPSGSAD